MTSCGPSPWSKGGGELFTTVVDRTLRRGGATRMVWKLFRAASETWAKGDGEEVDRSVVSKRKKYAAHVGHSCCTLKCSQVNVWLVNFYKGGTNICSMDEVVVATSVA